MGGMGSGGGRKLEVREVYISNLRIQLNLESLRKFVVVVIGGV